MKKTISKLWEDIFIDYDVLNEINRNNYFKITANDIRKYKEPRLMAKFDNCKQLPSIFKDNKLGILPIKNGEYIIGKFDLFQNLSSTRYEEIEIENVRLPKFLETLDPDNIYSESNALNISLLSGMLKDLYKEEFFETIQGKMRTNEFNFKISDGILHTEIKINGVAIEIDGGYESENKILLVEAKNYMPNDFIIRQLYYPYRHWKSKVTKEIVPVFLAYENGIYNFFIYEFTDIYNYNSIKLKFIKRYVVSNNMSQEIKMELFKNVNLIDELSQIDIPFPQADSFTKIIGVLELINNGFDTAKKISNELGFNTRQGKYYIDALRYLNLVKKSDKIGIYELSLIGFELVNSEMKKRNQKLISLILSHSPFYEVYKTYLIEKNVPSIECIKNILKKYIPNMADETINRRSSTIKSWIYWIIGAQV